MNKLLLVVLLAIAIIAAYLLVGNQLLQKEMRYTQSQALDFANQELAYRYPNASMEVFDIKNMSTVVGESWWLIRANVVYGKNTVCPNLTVVEVDQRFNFVPREKDIITENCRVSGCRNVQYCSINYAEEAILIPLDPVRNPATSAMLSSFISSSGGAGNVTTSAEPKGSFRGNTNITYSDVWVTRYSYPQGNQTIEVILNKTSGLVIEDYALS